MDGPLGALLLIAVTYLWWRGASRLTSLGVRDPRRRCVFLIVVLPVAVLGSVAAVPSVLIAMTAIHDGIKYRQDRIETTVILLVLFVLWVLGCACHRLTRWVIDDPGGANLAADDDEQQGPPPIA